MLKKFSISLACVALGAAYTASADTHDGKWVATFQFGTALFPHGQFQNRHSVNVADLGTISEPLEGEAGTVNLDVLTLDDVFRVGPTVGIELGYQVSSRFEPFARVSYTQFRGRNVHIGQIHSASLDAPVQIRGEFDDLKSFGLDLGARWFLVESGSVRPYLVGYVGVERSDELTVVQRIGGVRVEPRSQRLLPRETRFDTGVEVGLNYDFSDHGALRFSVGAEYATSRHEETTAYQALGIDRIRVTDQSWSLPINIGLSYKF